MKLIVISSSKVRPEDPKVITELFECGLNIFHLRKPSMTTPEMRKIIEAIPAHFHDRIVIHSHHKLASRFNLRGIHLTGIHHRRKFSTWMRMRMLQMKNDSLTVSTSFHKLAHAYSNKNDYHYAFIGTIFDRLNGNFYAGYNEHSVRAVTEKTTVPLIARGGTNASLVGRCVDLGFGGIAFSGTIWDSASPVQAWSTILTACKHESLSIE